MNRLKLVGSIYSNGLNKSSSSECPFCFINIMGEKNINYGVEASTKKSQARFQII